MKRKALIASLAVLTLLYCGSYVVFRTSGELIHFSNVDHWHPEKLSPAHHVGTPGDDGALLEGVY